VSVEKLTKQEVDTMVYKQSARGSGVNPTNDLSRELTRAKQAAMARHKAKKPIEPLLHPAKYEPGRVLIEKPAVAPQTKKKPPHT
jgi:hypothetical protein